MSIETLPSEASSRQRLSDPKPIRRKLPLQFRSPHASRGFGPCLGIFVIILCLATAFVAGSHAQDIQTSQPSETDVQPDPSAESDDPTVELSSTRLEISTEAEDAAESWWVEVTPLIGSEAPSFHRLSKADIESGADASGAGETSADVEIETLGFEPQVATGPAMVCLGAPGFGVSCRRHFLYRSVPFPGPAEQDFGTELDVLDDSARAAALRRDIEVSDLTVVLEPVRGRSTVGRVIQEGLPVAGARIYLIPADLMSVRPFTVPWPAAEPSPPASPSEPLPSEEQAVEVSNEAELLTQSKAADIQNDGSGSAADALSGLRRFVLTDDRGQFEIPPTAAGDYVLEAHLPTAQLHRVAFALPEPDALEEPESPGSFRSGEPISLSAR